MDKNSLTNAQKENFINVLLEYKGVPRDYLFEYPYNAVQSVALLNEAEAVLSKLLEVLDNN